jgi:hypothetical protein
VAVTAPFALKNYTTASRRPDTAAEAYAKQNRSKQNAARVFTAQKLCYPAIDGKTASQILQGAI